MDQLTGRITELFHKNKYVFLIILLGIAFMLLPTGRSEEAESSDSPVLEQPDMQTCLESILAQISGVGKVNVMLTVAEGSRTIYVRDEESLDASDRLDLRSNTVIITDSQRGENGLVVQVIPPVYQGAIIVCQGGDISSVRLAVVEAVCDATGLTSDRITVLKMK